MKTAAFWVAWLIACAVIAFGAVTGDIGMLLIGVAAAMLSGIVLARRLRD